MPCWQLGCVPVFRSTEFKRLSYLGSDIWLGTRPCSRNCWHCQSSHHKRSAYTGESCCQRSSVTVALDRDREPLLNGTGSSHLPGEDKGKVLVTHFQHAVAKTVAKYKQYSKLDRWCLLADFFLFIERCQKLCLSYFHQWVVNHKNRINDLFFVS